MVKIHVQQEKEEVLCQLQGRSDQSEDGLRARRGQCDTQSQPLLSLENRDTEMSKEERG